MIAQKKVPALTLAAKAPTDREIIWAAMRMAGQLFTQSDLVRLSGCDKPKIQDYLKGLMRAGIVHKKTEDKRFATAAYELVRDTGVDAPRVRKDGTLLPQSGRQRMWQAMRVLGAFTEDELQEAASLPDAPVAPGEVATYCSWLGRGGYLRACGTGCWQFVPATFTGPKAPQVLRVKQLLDPNTSQIMHEAEKKGRDDE